MGISLKDVAEATGVSVATVSRVLGGNTGHPISISVETRRRVMAASKRLGYRPHRLAQSLKRGKTRTVGVIVPRLQSPHAADFVDAVWECSAHHDHGILLGYSRHDPRRESEQVSLLLEHRVDGVIVLLSARGRCEYRDWIEPARATGIACVVVRERVKNPDVDFVTCDMVSGARQAVGHLIALGHRRIGHLSGALDAASGVDRLQGYLDALADAGMPADPDIIAGGRLSEESAAEGMALLLDLPDPPTAVFAANDFLAVAAMKTIREHGLRVPQDIAVVGFGDLYWSDALGLTTVHEPVDEMGARAAQRLFELLDDPGSPPQTALIPTHLVVRASCGGGDGFAPLVGSTPLSALALVGSQVGPCSEMPLIG